MSNLPPFVRNFVIDFIETGIAVVFALNLVIPGSLDEAKAQAVLIGGAVISAFISAARRAAPAFIEWVRSQFGV